MDKTQMIETKIKIKEKELTAARSEKNTIDSRLSELYEAYRELDSQEDKKVLDDEIRGLNKDLSRLTDTMNSINRDILNNQFMIDDLIDKENEEEERTNTNKGGVKTMKKSTQRSIARFVQTNGDETGRLEVDTEGVIIPQEELSNHLQHVDMLDLSKHVRIIKTDKANGKFPLMKKTKNKFTKVSELAENTLPEPEMLPVEYEIDTFRGVVPVSQELAEDSEELAADLVVEYFNDLEVNTKNSEIISVMKTAAARTATGLDEVKSLINKDISDVYNAKAYVSTSLFDELDSLKDNSGRYLLQDDNTVKSGKRVRGKEVVVIPDTEIGTTEGDLVGFFGDLHEFVVLFDREKNTMKWADDKYGAQRLNGVVRFDTKVGDNEAGYYVTYTPAV
ncbi:phage major capsid protein [Alkalibacterium gilvum]|uniref:phage major capsid protein n=1 Tax=Alkalibacterium gilvum TaxID=1130080 RepID=UPI003F91F641